MARLGKHPLFETRKHQVRSVSQVAGNIGTVTEVGDRSFCISAHGGKIEVLKVRYGDGAKLPAARFCAGSGVGVGAQLD